MGILLSLEFEQTFSNERKSGLEKETIKETSFRQEGDDGDAGDDAHRANGGGSDCQQYTMDRQFAVRFGENWKSLEMHWSRNFVTCRPHIEKAQNMS